MRHGDALSADERAAGRNEVDGGGAKPAGGAQECRPVADPEPLLWEELFTASSKRDAGGKRKPPSCGSRPVALHTAVISMPDLVPSMKLLNIFGLIEPRSTMFRYLSRMSQSVSGVDW